MGLSFVEGNNEESLCRQGECELAIDICVRGTRRDSGGLYGLSLRSGAATMPATMHNPASPGELLREFMGNHSATELAEHIGVARGTISRILNGRTAVTMDLSIRLGEAFSLLPDFFSKAQLQRNLWEVSQRKCRKIKPLAA
jgi:antitoxin HigA-1